MNLRQRKSSHLMSTRSTGLALLLAGLCLGQAALAAEPIRICFVDDRSGAAADTGRLSFEGTQIAVDEANAAGGVKGHKVELIAYDGKTDPQLSATFAQRCAEDDKALVIVGGDPTAPAAAMIPVANNNRVTFFILGATADNLTLPPTPYVFRFGPNSSQETLAAADLLARQGFKRVAIINNSTPSALDYARALTAALKERNVPIVTQQVYDISAADVSPQVANIREAKPDVIVAFPYPADGARVMRTVRQLGLTTPTLMVRVALMDTFRKLAADAADGLVTPDTVDFNRPDVKQHFATLDARFGPHQPMLFSVVAYDATKVALALAAQPQVLAALDANNLAEARTAFRDAVERIGEFKGLQGHPGAVYRFSAASHQGVNGNNWYVYTQVGDKGTKLFQANLNAFKPKP